MVQNGQDLSVGIFFFLYVGDVPANQNLATPKPSHTNNGAKTRCRQVAKKKGGSTRQQGRIDGQTMPAIHRNLLKTAGVGGFL